MSGPARLRLLAAPRPHLARPRQLTRAVFGLTYNLVLSWGILAAKEASLHLHSNFPTAKTNKRAVGAMLVRGLCRECRYTREIYGTSGAQTLDHGYW